MKYATEANGPDGVFYPYARDEKTGARPWAIPGTPGLEHRVGGLEKQALTGNVSYDPDNHELMTAARAAKIAGIANDIPEVGGSRPRRCQLLVVSWGSTYGSVRAGVNNAGEGRISQPPTSISRHLNPFPKNLGEVLAGYEKVLVPGAESGPTGRGAPSQVSDSDRDPCRRCKGAPFMANEMTKKIIELLEDQS